MTAVSALHRIAKAPDSKGPRITEDHRLARLVGFCFENVRNMREADLANVAWSLANLRYKDADMMPALAREATLKIGYMSVQGLSNLAWAFSTLSIRSEGLFKAIAEESVSKIENFTPANLGMTAWAYSVAKVQHEDVLAALIDETAKKVSAFSEQKIGHICHSFRSLDRQFEAGQLWAAWQQLQPEQQGVPFAKSQLQGQRDTAHPGTEAAAGER